MKACITKKNKGKFKNSKSKVYMGDINLTISKVKKKKGHYRSISDNNT